MFEMTKSLLEEKKIPLSLLIAHLPFSRKYCYLVLGGKKTPSRKFVYELYQTLIRFFYIPPSQWAIIDREFERALNPRHCQLK